jgi:capsular polysaccharide biosynthesis protein
MDLAEFATALRRSFLLIAFATVAAGGAAFAVSMALPKEYEAEARVLVGSLTDTSTDQLAAYRQQALTYVEFATSGPLLDRVIDELGLTETSVELARRIDARTPAGQPILRILASSPSAVESAELANAIADEITLLARPENATTSLATVYQPATVPTNPVSPRIPLNTIIGAGLGLVAAVGLALLFGTPSRGRPE